MTESSEKQYPDLDNSESEEMLLESLDTGDYAVYDPDYYVEDGRVTGLLITGAGYVLTFIVDPEWGPCETSATYQCHVTHDGCKEEWLRLYEEAQGGG